MSEAGLRQGLVAAIIAAVVGVVALALGAFISPIPDKTDAAQVATALFVRGVLALSSIAIAFYIAYWSGARIERTASERAEAANPAPDPSAGSPIVSLFTTPGSRRDALFAGGIVMLAYWLLTSLYILALGKAIGNLGVNTADIPSFIWTRTLEGIALIAAGMGCGALGARAAYARRLTGKALSIPPTAPGLPADFPPPANPTSTDPTPPQE